MIAFAQPEPNPLVPDLVIDLEHIGTEIRAWFESEPEPLEGLFAIEQWEADHDPGDELTPESWSYCGRTSCGGYEVQVTWRGPEDDMGPSWQAGLVSCDTWIGLADGPEASTLGEAVSGMVAEVLRCASALLKIAGQVVPR